MSEDNFDNPADRRKHVRYDLATQAQIFFEPERKLIVTVADLSYEGLCVEAAAADFVYMLPPMDSAGGYDKVPLRLCFDVVRGDSHCEIRLLVSSIYLKSVASGLSQLGLEIIDVEHGVLEFSDYIVELGNNCPDIQ